MKSLLGLVQSAPCRIDIEFKDADGKPHQTITTVKSKKEEAEEVPVYSNKDTVQGEIRLTPLTAKKLEHQGIKVQLVGQIELASERGTGHEFVSLVRELAAPGDLNSTKLYPFEFKNVELQYDSYRGQQVRCRYLLRVTVTGKGMTPDSKREFNLWVTNYEQPNEAAAPIKMEVGIEDCLHIEFEYDRARYHLRDVVVGRIYFLLVRIKLKHMEVEIRRKETTGAGTAAHSESETLAKYEIMDGAPVRGESVPIRLYLSPFDLAPSYRDIHNKFSVRYFLNLVLVDEEDRRYFKQQEITLYRKAADTPAEAAANAQAGPPKLASAYSMPPAATAANGSVSSPTGAAHSSSSGTVTAPPAPQFAPLPTTQPPVTAAAVQPPAAAAPAPTPQPPPSSAPAPALPTSGGGGGPLSPGAGAPAQAADTVAALTAGAEPTAEGPPLGLPAEPAAAKDAAAEFSGELQEGAPDADGGLTFGDGDSKTGIL